MKSVETSTIDTGETTIYVQRSGNGPGLLLLHGFPQTHLMWRDVVPMLEQHFTVICADLRGYGNSGCPVSDIDHYPYSKRAMARDMAIVMSKIGFNTFFVAGHDRGGRVAYRLALDYPEQVQGLAVFDIVPILEAWDRADRNLAETFWPWSLLSQPKPFPEQMILGAPHAVINNALTSWGTEKSIFSMDVREAYIKVLQDPMHVHSICEEFRAAATIDYAHDKANRLRNQRVTCPVLVLWAKYGALDTWYNAFGGPLAIWNNWANLVTGEAIEGGHFFPEEEPKKTAELLLSFLLSIRYANSSI
jgi:haloacetate dehalogenase